MAFLSITPAWYRRSESLKVAAAAAEGGTSLLTRDQTPEGGAIAGVSATSRAEQGAASDVGGKTLYDEGAVDVVGEVKAAVAPLVVVTTTAGVVVVIEESAALALDKDDSLGATEARGAAAAPPALGRGGVDPGTLTLTNDSVVSGKCLLEWSLPKAPAAAVPVLLVLEARLFLRNQSMTFLAGPVEALVLVEGVFEVWARGRALRSVGRKGTAEGRELEEDGVGPGVVGVAEGGAPMTL